MNKHFKSNASYMYRNPWLSMLGKVGLQVVQKSIETMLCLESGTDDSGDVVGTLRFDLGRKKSSFKELQK